MEKFIVSSSPHIRAKDTTQTIMRDVLIALSPAAVAGVVLFGLRALAVILACVISAVLSEFLFNLICKKEQTVFDLSAVVTGLILALCLPSKVEIWQCVIGSAFAIIVVKCLFGGLGCNFANPAATARVFLLSAFAESINGSVAARFMAPELVGGSTPLAVISQGSEVGFPSVANMFLNTHEGLPSIVDMLFGVHGGAIGETCIIALVLGGLYLIIRRVIAWEVPVTYLATIFVLSLIVDRNVTVALYQVLGGGAVIAAFFMITDYVSTPVNKLGKIVFAFGCGAVTMLIRFSGVYPEGASIAILIMNILAPYIEKLCKAKPLGKVGK